MTALPVCPRCALPVGEGSCAGCRNVRSRELADAYDAIDGAPVDAAWLRGILGDDWRESLHLRGLVVLADRALAANPLSPAAVDRLLDGCADDDRDQVARFRYALVLGAVTRGGIEDELARLDVLLTDDRVDVGGLVRHLAGLARIEWAQTTALLLPDPDNLPFWLRRDGAT